MKTLLPSSLVLSVFLFVAIPSSVTLAQVTAPITSSGLNTQISPPAALPGGQIVYDITGGTRPGNGPNLFHSFGDFNVPTNNIANFLNETGLPTSNILGRVTGGDISNIFGTVQTTNFGNANLFLVNPAGFLFGPNATVNVGGMVAFTSADYLRLADGVRFKAIPNATADALLSVAPVAAFGFLGSNPGAITVQGSQLSVMPGQVISMVGGDITVQSGTLEDGTVQPALLSAPGGQINLVSVGRPSKPKVGGEVVIAGSGQESGFTPTGFRSMGTINLSQGSTIDASAVVDSGQAAGGVLIRGGQFVMDASTLQNFAATSPFFPDVPPPVGGPIEVTAEQVALSNHSRIDTGVEENFGGSAGPITFNVDAFSAIDSTISAQGGFFPGGTSGAVTIQGIQGPGASAYSVSLTNTEVTTRNSGFGLDFFDGGPILIRADNIALNQSSLITFSGEATGGPITLVSSNRIESHDSFLSTTSLFGSGGNVDLRAGAAISLTGSGIRAESESGSGGTITMAAPFISISGSFLLVGSEFGHAGTISITGTKAVSLTNGIFGTFGTLDTFIDASGQNGGTILINGGGRFTSRQSTISAQSQFGNGGTINVRAKGIVSLNETLLTTGVSGGPQTIAGEITIDANAVKVKNSQILSTATEGQGGTIDITSHNGHQVINSVIDATSQFGTDGTVTITGPKKSSWLFWLWVNLKTIASGSTKDSTQ
jgi:filamentous hemagglutinin family protein